MSLDNLLYPNNIEIKEKGLNSKIISFFPLERGFGYTLGFALRQALLFNIEGCSIYSLKVNNMKNLEDDWNLTKESFSELILNIKGILVSFQDDMEEDTVSFSSFIEAKSADKVISAIDIGFPKEVKVLNENHFICNLNKGESLKLDIVIKKGKGYLSQRYDSDDNGYFYLDCNFSPVLHCTFNVGNTRVGKRTDLDKLIVSVTTNGSIECEAAVKKVAELIKEQIHNVVDFSIISEREKSDSEDEIDSFLLKSVEHLDLTVRSMNCLRNMNIKFIGELIKIPETDLLKTPNFGRKSLSEIKEKLSENSYVLGQEIPNLDNYI